MAQSAEHILGKDEVVGSIPTISSSPRRRAANPVSGLPEAGYFSASLSGVFKISKAFSTDKRGVRADNPPMVIHRRVIFSPISFLHQD